MSRRFKNRHAKVVADPAALPVAAVTLDDSNSYVDCLQPDRRIPLTLNTRAWAQAESTMPPDFAEVQAEFEAATDADLGKPEPSALDRLAAMRAEIAKLEAETHGQTA